MGLKFSDNSLYSFYAREFDFGIFCAEIPNNEYIEYFAPDYTLKVPNLNMVKKHLPVGLY